MKLTQGQKQYMKNKNAQLKGRTTLTREVTISDELLDLIFNV